jgi:hypothetical protein
VEPVKSLIRSHEQIKVVLDPALNKLVFSGELAKLNIIRILDGELELKGHVSPGLSGRPLTS